MDYDELKLEPIRFLPDKVDMPWGSAEYILADLGFVDSLAAEGILGGNSISELMETYLERISGENAFDAYGTQFPVMVKRLNVKGRTSLHVNPDDTTAMDRYDSLGKTALWYVLEADKDSRLWLGFRRDVSPSEFYDKCLSGGDVESLLREVKPHPGQLFLIPPGTVHAAKNVKLLEIAESSELWFRLHEWEPSEREIHLEEAFDLIDFHAAGSLETQFPVKLPQMRVRKLNITVPSGVESPDGDSFRLYVSLKGSLNVDGCSIGEGGAVLVPADVLSWHLIPGADGTEVLEITVDKIPEEEPWTTAE
ncbi:MAG: class I mannose-6-phosphate isomerase [Bacteroidales bacterium]|nr:class I mannose-6-phosphate isomerase [Bacteroidales bacterium]